METLPYSITGPPGQQRQQEVVAAKGEDLRSNYHCFYHCHWKVPDRLLSKSFLWTEIQRGCSVLGVGSYDY